MALKKESGQSAPLTSLPSARPAPKRASLIQPGRGLGALLSRQDVSRTARHTELARLSDIEPDPEQPRKNFDTQTLSDLTESVKVHGLLQPLIVTPTGAKGKKRYRIVAGERRYHACQAAGIEEVPVRIVRGSESELREISLVENLQRDDLNVIEVAVAVKSLMEKENLTQEQAAGMIGIARPALSNKLRLLTLPEAVRSLIVAGRISESHAKVLLSLKDPDKYVVDLAEDCARENWSVRELTRRVDAANGRGESRRDISRVEWKPKGVAGLSRKLGFAIKATSRGTDNRLVLSGLSREQVNRVCEALEREMDFLLPQKRHENPTGR